MVEIEEPKTKRGRGRPRSKNLLDFAAAPAVDPEAEPVEAAPVESFDFGTPYQTFGAGQAAEFQKFTEQYPDRRDISCYVWRLDPPIDRRQVGISDSNIEIIPGAVDLEALLAKHGSGEYHLKFNDSNVKPAQRAKCTVKLDDPTKPPNVNPQELLVSGVKGNRNAALIARYVGMGWSVTDKKNELIPEGFRALEPPAAVAPIAESAKSAGVDKALVELLRESLLKRDAHQGGELDRAFQIADRLKPAAPTMDPVLGKLLAAAVDRMLIPAAPAAAPDPMEHIEKMGNFFSKMGWTAPGAGGGSAGPSWTEALAALPGILQHGAALVSQLMAYRMMTTAAPAGAPGQAAAAAPPFVPAFLPATVPAAPAATPGGDEEMLNPAKLAALMEVGRMAQKSIEEGEPGDDFAEKLCESPQFAPIYDDLVEMGKAGIIATLGSIPGLSARLDPRRVELEVWLDRFLAYNDTGEPEPEAPAAAPTA